MVTGDAAPTALAISKQVALVSVPDVDVFAHFAAERAALGPHAATTLATAEPQSVAVVVEGKELDAIDEAGWEYIFKHREMVFARTTPDHKLMIVKEAQRRGNRVGVTGDGTCFAPSLPPPRIFTAPHFSPVAFTSSLTPHPLPSPVSHL